MSDQRFDWFRIVLLAIAVAGLLVSLALVHISAGEHLPDIIAWACGQPTATGQTGCDQTLQSGYSQLVIFPPRPIPVATLGMAYFTAMGLWLLVVGRLPGKLHRAWLAPSVLGLLGLLVSAFFIYLMGKVIHSWCGLCLLTHALNLPLVLGIWILWLAGPSRWQVAPQDQADQTGPSPAGHLWKVPALALLVGLAIGLAQIRDAQTSDAMQALDAESNTLDEVYYKQIARYVDIPIDEDDPVLGPASAPHTVVIFSDLECPTCARFVPMIEQVQKELAVERAVKSGKVVPLGEELDYAPFRIVFKHFPLNRTCNKYWKPLAPAVRDHQYACEAAAAAEAARQLGGSKAFWKMHDAIAANRTTLAEQPYKTLAEQIGLDGEQFEKVRKDPQTMERITHDMKQGQQAGVRTTPSIFLDGRRVERPVRQGVQPVQKTAALWNRLMAYSEILRVMGSGSQPAATSRAEYSEQLRRSRAAAAATQPHRQTATSPASQPGMDAPEPPPQNQDPESPEAPMEAPSTAPKGI